MKKRRIAIIGAGLAGLTAAWRLRERGLDPVVFEAEPEPGGRARSVHENGLRHDLGAWTFTADGPVSRFVRELGLAEDLVMIPATVGRPVNGRLRVADLARPLSFIGGFFSPAEVFSLTRAVLQARTLPNDAPDESAGEWAARRFATPFIQDVLKPLAGLYFLQDLHSLSRNAFQGTLGYLTGIRLNGFRTGMGCLTDFLASRLVVHTGSGIHSVQMSGAGVQVFGAGFTETAEGLIAATPLPEAARLLGPWLDRDTLQAAKGWRYAPTVTVQFLIRGRWPNIALQVLPPRGRTGPVCGLTVERAKHPARVPAGYELVTLYAAPEMVSMLMEESDSDLFNRFAAELGAWMNLPAARIQPWRVRRWPLAAAFTDPAAPERISILEWGFAALARKMPIWAAGDFRGSSGLPGAVTSAERAAGACADYFEKIMNHFHFLLVDDEKDFIDTLAKRLRQRGFSADCAYSGQAALDRLDEEPDLIDVILLDIKMPEPDGIETLALVKEKHPLPEVIMLTSHASVASAVEALKKGAFDYLTKPCDLEDVIAKAERAVSRKRERAAKIREIQAIPFISDRERERRIEEILKDDGG